MRKLSGTVFIIVSIIMAFCPAESKCLREKRIGQNDFWDIVGGFSFLSADQQLRFYEIQNPFYDIIDKTTVTPEIVVASAGKLIDLLKMYDGKEFNLGRNLKYESTYLLYAYEGYVNAYGRMGNCEEASKYLKKLRELMGRDYLVVKYMSPKLFDPVVDSGVYRYEKALSEKQLFLNLNLNNVYFDGSEFSDVKRIVEEKKLIEKIYEKEMYAFGYWEKKPGNGIINAEKLIELMNEKDGYIFRNGKTLSKDSSMILAAYTAMAIGYDHKPSCRNARRYMDEIRKYASRDYQVYMPETGEIYEPSDGVAYKDEKKCDLETIWGYGAPAYKCFTKDEFALLFASGE